MKKLTIIALALLLLIGGPALYFLSSPDRQVTETFSTFSFKNDAVERPATEGEEDWYGGDLGDPEEVTEYEDDWYGEETSGNDSSQDSSSGGSSSNGGGGSAPSTGGTPTNTTEPSLSYTPSQTTPSTATPKVSTPTTPKSYTLSITSPTAGSVLSNKTCPTSSDTTCYERPIATIFWTYGDLSARITIELWSKNGLVRTLTTKTGNSGRHAWDPSLTLPDGDYKLIVRAYSSSGTLVATAETGYFEVSKVKDEDIAPASPTNPTSPGTPPFPSAIVEQIIYEDGRGQNKRIIGTHERITAFEVDMLEGEEAIHYSQAETSCNLPIPGGCSGAQARYDVWMSVAPGGEPLSGIYNAQYTGTSLRLYNKSLTQPWWVQESLKVFPGRYYINIKPIVPEGYLATDWYYQLWVRPVSETRNTPPPSPTAIILQHQVLQSWPPNPSIFQNLTPRSATTPKIAPSVAPAPEGYIYHWELAPAGTAPSPSISSCFSPLPTQGSPCNVYGEQCIAGGTIHTCN